MFDAAVHPFLTFQNGRNSVSDVAAVCAVGRSIWAAWVSQALQEPLVSGLVSNTLAVALRPRNLKPPGRRQGVSLIWTPRPTVSQALLQRGCDRGHPVVTQLLIHQREAVGSQ